MFKANSVETTKLKKTLVMLPVRLLPPLAGDQAEPIVSKGYSFVFFRLHCCATVDQHIFGSVC